MSQNLSSAAVVIGALRVKTYSRVEIYRDIHCLIFLICAIKDTKRLWFRDEESNNILNIANSAKTNQ